MAVARAALAMRDALAAFTERTDWPLTFRCGMATGITISGVIADARPRFDLWGEALEQATRIGQQAGDGELRVNEAAYWRLKSSYDFEACADGSYALQGSTR